MVAVPITQVVAQCAPQVNPDTLAAIIRVESGGDALVLHDNSNGRTYHPKTRAQAIQILTTLMATGARVDVGLGQVDTENFARYGLTAHNAFNVCRNIQVAGKILTVDYRLAKMTYPAGQPALYHTFELYNSGNTSGDAGYADRILAAAGYPVYLNMQSQNPGTSGAISNNFPQYPWVGASNGSRLQSVSWSILP
jgi:type IV secretion system protein VirB1